MYKDGVLTVSEWNKGQVSHPIYGFSSLKNVEIFENPGLVKIKKRSLSRDGLIPFSPDALPIAEVYDEYGNTYTLTGITGTGSFYKNGSSIQGSLTNAWDLAIYKDYVWVRHGGSLSCYGPLNNSPEWFADVDTGFDENYYGKLLVGQDDYLYSANGNAISRTEVTASGTPSVAPSTTTTLARLDLPDGQYAVTLEELGTYIMIGTQGGANYADRGNFANARLYPWNRKAGTLGNPGLADLPVIFSENGINAIKQHANRLYVSAGTKGNVYMADGTNYTQIAKLPYSKLGTNYSANVYPNAISVSPQGHLQLGLSGEKSDYTNFGIYEIDITDSQFPIAFSTTSSVTDGDFKIGFIKQKDYQTRNVGWSSVSAFDVDYTDDKLYNSFGVGAPVIETPLERVGTFHNKKTFQHVGFNLAEPLVSGQSIRISYRLNSQDDYTTIGTWSFADLGAVISHEDTAAIADAEYIQLKIEMTQDTSTAITNNIYLISVTLR